MLCRDGCRWCVLNVDGELEVGKCGLKRQSKNWFAKAEYDLHPDMAYFDARYVEGEMISPEKINQMPTMKEIKRCLLTKDGEYINDIFPQSERKITCNNLPNCIFDDMTATCNPSSDEPKNNEVEPQTVEMRHVVRNESGSSGSSGPGNMENDSSGSSGPGNMESGSSGSSGPGNEEESDSSGSSGPGNMESGSSGSSGPGNEESGSSGPENEESGASGAAAPAGTKCCYKNGIPPMLFKGKCPSKTNELPLAKCQNNSDDNGEVCCKSKNAKSPSLFDKKCPAGAAEYPIEKCKEKKGKKEKDVKPEPNAKQCCKAPGIAKPKIYNNCPPQMKAISMDKCDSKAPVKAKPAATKIVEKKEDVTKYLNKMCTPKDIKNMMGKCLDKTNPKYCQNGEYHDSNCKGPSSIACCVVRANNDRKASTSTSEKVEEEVKKEVENDDDTSLVSGDTD